MRDQPVPVVFDWSRWSQTSTAPATETPAVAAAPVKPVLVPEADQPAIRVRDQADFDSADLAVLQFIADDRKAIRSQGTRRVSGIPDGWTPDRWIGRNRQLADACGGNRPDLAAQYRAEAYRIEEALLK